MASLYQYLLKRAVYTIMTLFLVSVAIFGITQALPGSAAQMILGQYATEESIAALEQELGLDQPVYIQYFDWLIGIVSGNWGDSLIHRTPVADLVVPRLIRSVELALLTMVLITLIGIPLGVLAAVKRNTVFDSLVSGISYAGVSVPEFVTGALLILLLAGEIQCLIHWLVAYPMQE
ncbi:ABC transporter permease [Natronorubrum tibetense]|uniref:ABC transporter permease n=1 Tax=Natronorubrum tibetense TaxID=63128 RepID=UPI001F4D2C30|nr:ABC transporter permease [Natronorubrum tibetense]